MTIFMPKCNKNSDIFSLYSVYGSRLRFVTPVTRRLVTSLILNYMRVMHFRHDESAIFMVNKAVFVVELQVLYCFMYVLHKNGDNHAVKTDSAYIKSSINH
jgi:hypothetical protein